MERILVHFSANEQKLICSDPFQVSSYKVQYIEAHFDLGQNWSGYDSIRAVWWNDFVTRGIVLDSLGVCRVPAEVLTRKGPVMVNLVGSISDGEELTDRLTTYPVEAGVVDANAKIDGPDPHPATPSQVEQFADRVRNDANRAETAASGAEASASEASASATSAANSATAAHNDKVAIEQAIAEVIQKIDEFEQVEVNVNTLPPGSDATSDFADGVLTLGIPRGDKGDTGNGIQSITKVSTSGLVDTYRITYTDGQTTTFTVTNGQKGDTGNGIQSIAKTSTVGLVDTYTITYTNGNTTTFTVTNGEKGDKGDTGEVSLSELEDATIVQTLSDTEPYHFRRTNNGQGSGHREYDEIVGASVGWNQLIPYNDFTDESKWACNASNSKDVANNVLTLTLNANATNSTYLSSTNIIKSTVNHIYMYDACVKPSRATKVWMSYSAKFYNTKGTNCIAAQWNDCAGIIKARESDVDFLLYLSDPATLLQGDTVDFSRFQVFDLTLMLGSTIADYVYSLEQSTSGAGVAWLKTHFPKLFDNGYQPFDSGSIKSVTGLSAHEMVGKNLLNPNDPNYENCTITSTGEKTTGNRRIATGFISCEPNKTYTLSGAVSTGGGGGLNFAGIAGYDGNLNFISRSYVNNQYSVSYTTPTNCHYIRVFEEITNEPAGGGNINPSVFTKYIQQLELGSTATPYEPHESHTYTLDSSVTLRGKYVLDNGQLKAVGDVWKSVGEITRNAIEIDLGTLTWRRNGSGTPAQFFASLPSRGVDDITGGNVVCSKYAGGRAYNGSVDKVICIRSAQVWLTDDNYSDGTSLKASLDGVKLVYPLETSTTESAEPYTSPQWVDPYGTEEYVSTSIVPIGHNTEYPMTLVDTMPNSNGTYEPRVTIANGKRTITWQSV